MSKCSYCGKVSLFAVDKDSCLCKACSDKFLPQIAHCKTAIKRGLINARYSDADDTVLKGLEEVCGSARRLLRFEQIGIPTTKPPPSRILEIALEQREELLQSGPVPTSPTVESPDGQRESLNARRCEGPVSSPGPVNGEGRRRAERWSASFYTTLEPGGFRALVNDVSASGMFLSCSTSRAVGSRVRMTLYTGRGNIQTEAVVRRNGVTNGHDRFAEHTGLGVQFIHPMPQLARLVPDKKKGQTAIGE